jgi:hypothetical protein
MSVLGNLSGIIGAGLQGTNTGAGTGGISPLSYNQSAARNTIFNNAINSQPAPSPPVKNIHDITLADLKNEAMLAPISVLVSMWLAKYQNEWVLSEDVVTDDFFRLVANRLIKLNKLEIVHVIDKWQDAYRLIEDEE